MDPLSEGNRLSKNTHIEFAEAVAAKHSYSNEEGDLPIHNSRILSEQTEADISLSDTNMSDILTPTSVAPIIMFTTPSEMNVGADRKKATTDTISENKILSGNKSYAESDMSASASEPVRLFSKTNAQSAHQDFEVTMADTDTTCSTSESFLNEYTNNPQLVSKSTAKPREGREKASLKPKLFSRYNKNNKKDMTSKDVQNTDANMTTTDKMFKVPFIKGKNATNNTFTVDYEESIDELSINESVDSGRPQIFKTKENNKQDTFAVGYEESIEASVDESMDSGRPQIFKTKENDKQNTFAVGYEESVEASIDESMDIERPQIFKTKENNKQDTFAVGYEESIEASVDESMDSGRPEIFQTKENDKQNTFAVGYEESTEVSQDESVDSGRPQIFKTKKNNKQDTFAVGYEESTEVSQDESVDSGRPQIFKTKENNKQNTFAVGYEESVEASLNGSENSTRPQIFTTKHDKQNTFAVGYEESVETSLDRSENPEKPQIFETKDNDKQNTFAVGYEESVETSLDRSENPEKPQIFKTMDNDKQNTFAVGYEDSVEASLNGSENSVRPQIFQAINSDEQITFAVGYEESMEASPSENSLENSEPLLRDMDRESINAHNNETEKSSTVLNTTVVDATAVSMKPNVNLSSSINADATGTTATRYSENTSKHDMDSLRSATHEESSYNDENLNCWMSDDEVGSSTPARSNALSETQVVQSPTCRLPVTTQDEDWEQEIQDLIANAKKRKRPSYRALTDTPKVKKHIGRKPKVVEETESLCKKPKLKKPAKFATKTFYDFLISKLKPQFHLDSYIKAEEVMCYLADVVKLVQQRKTHQKAALDKLKKYLAQCGIVDTTMDFYSLIEDFLPVTFNKKVIPCFQPITNIVWPPEVGLNPLDKIITC